MADNCSWSNVLPTSLISVTGVSIAYITASTTMLAGVPVNVKSLCGGMVTPRLIIPFLFFFLNEILTKTDQHSLPNRLRCRPCSILRRDPVRRREQRPLARTAVCDGTMVLRRSGWRRALVFDCRYSSQGIELEFTQG